MEMFWFFALWFCQAYDLKPSYYSNCDSHSIASKNLPQGFFGWGWGKAMVLAINCYIFREAKAHSWSISLLDTFSLVTFLKKISFNLHRCWLCLKRFMLMSCSTSWCLVNHFWMVRIQYPLLVLLYNNY